MSDIEVHQQFHGYRNGHQLLASTVMLTSADQDTLNYLSDISGSLDPRQTFEPYLTGYPLPSGDFYVLARTWQELTARRAGCVFTRSLVFSIRQWLDLNSLGSAAQALAGDEIPEVEDSVAFVDEYYVPIPIVEDERLGAMAEKLFLPDGRPVVVFGLSSAVEISLRTIEAAWPRFRQQFSFSTLALSPRSIEGHPLQLQFAPNSSQGKFAAWKGARIGNSRREENSPPSKAGKLLAAKVFTQKVPDLKSLDRSGLFWSEGKNIDPRLGVVLLWNELSSKADHSESALLGLIDISSTLSARDADALLQIQRPILTHLQRVSTSHDLSENFPFLVAISEKLAHRTPVDWLRKAVSKAIEQTAVRQPRDVLLKFVEVDSSDNWIQLAARDGAASAFFSLEPAQLEEIGEDENSLLKVFLLSATRRPLAGVLIELLQGREVLLNELILSGERIFGVGDFERASSAVVGYLWEKDHILVLETILRSKRFRFDAGNIAFAFANNSRASDEFIKALAELDVIQPHIFELQQDLLRRERTEKADMFLVSSLLVKPEAFGKFVAERTLPRRRAADIVFQIVDKSSKKALSAFLEAWETDKVVDLLIETRSCRPFHLNKVLTGVRTPTDQLLNGALVYFSSKIEANSEGLPQLACEIARLSFLVEGDIANEALQVISSFLGDSGDMEFDGVRLVPHGAPPAVVERNLTFLGAYVASRDSKSFSNHAELATEMISYGLKRMSASTWKLLVPLVRGDRFKPEVAHVEFASKLVSASIELTRSDVSELLNIMFPIVHEALKQQRRSPSVFSFFFLSDWDKCKAARKSLVAAYMRSVWPVSDLLKIAASIGELRSILSLIDDQPGSQDYIERVFATIDELPEDVRREISLEDRSVRSLGLG